MLEVLFVGCGKMGGAILKNLKNSQQFKDEQIKLSVIDPSSFIARSPNVAYYKDAEELPENYLANLVILAIKPQDCQEVLSKIVKKSNFFDSSTLFFSIIAGKKVSFYEEILPQESKIVRSMPNLPVAIGCGVLAYFCNKNVTENDLRQNQFLLDSFIYSLRVSQENLLDDITAVSGSSPAYLFLFVEKLIDAAISLGLDSGDAENLVKYSIFGAAKMTLDADPCTLRKNVTSKAGTTAAALEVFEASEFSRIVKRAVIAAKNRSKKL